MHPRYRYIFHIDGENSEVITESFAKILLGQGKIIPPRAVRIQRSVMDWLDGLDVDWLMVVDDYYLSDRRELTGRTGNVIYTSESPTLGAGLPYGCSIQVTPLDREHAAGKLSGFKESEGVGRAGDDALLVTWGKLACPFQKALPDLHLGCLGRNLNRIQDVKQHLRRSHFRTYCNKCSTLFPFRSALEDHGCPKPGAAPILIEPRYCITDREYTKLGENARGSPEEQWFLVWDMLFPDRPRPYSPYQDGEITPDQVVIRE
jgi:hypothetical protein